MFKKYVEPESPNEGVCSRYTMIRTRLFFKLCKVALKHMILFETHHASIVFANEGVAPPQPPFLLSRASLPQSI